MSSREIMKLLKQHISVAVVVFVRILVQKENAVAIEEFLVIKSIQAFHRAADAQEFLMLEQATSMRQAAEWGMHALQSSFGRLHGILKYEKMGQRSLILQSIVFLHNWRVNTVGLNQIQTVFMPHLAQNVDQYLFGDDFVV
jgi:hypothetical protein